MPLLTQPQLNSCGPGTQFLAGSLAFDASTSSQGSKSKQLFILQYNDWLSQNGIRSSIYFIYLLQHLYTAQFQSLESEAFTNQ